MASDKTIIGLALLAGIEPGYNSGSALSTGSNGIQVATLPSFDLAYAYDGSRPLPPGTAGVQIRNAPSGRTAASKISIEAKGAGVTYTTASTPPMHVFLRASGLTATISASAYVYTPDVLGVTPASLALGVYRRSEYWTMQAGYATFTLAATNAAAPLFEFDVSAVAFAPTDSVCPVVTYPYASVVPPKAESINCVINGVSNLKVRNFKYEYGRKLQARLDINSSTLGHAGFAPGQHEGKLTLTVESEPLTLIDPYNLQLTATTIPVSITIGSVANNRYTLSLANAQIIGVKGSAEGPVALWELDIEGVQSSPSVADDLKLIFN